MQELERAKDNFLLSVKNHFQEPIEDSLDSIEKLLQTSLTIEQTSIIDSLAQVLSSLHRSSKNLVSIADIKSKNIVLNPVEFSPIEVFENIISSFLDAAAQKGLSFLVYIDPNAPKSMTADIKLLTIVLENLLSNAISYTSSGGTVYVDIKIKHNSDLESNLTVTVTDNGMGVDKNKVKSYLQASPFSDGENNLGVGLSAAFFILKSMDTQLKIASEENKGSRFSFSLNLPSSSESMFLAHPDIKIGVLIDDREVFSYAKLLYQYIISMGLAVVSIQDVNDENLKECHGVFFLTSECDPSRVKNLSIKYPNTTFVPTILAQKSQEFLELGCADRLLLLPAVPTSINTALSFIKIQVPKEIAESNRQDHAVIQQLAEQAKTEQIKILIVEDNPINLKLVKVVLSRYDFDVDTAENGRIGVNLCKKKRYDVVLMDIDMPVMDGITATKYIKEYENNEGLPETPIVALTSHDLAGERAEIMASGLDEHMPKPLNVARLELMLENYIGFKPERIKKG